MLPINSWWFEHVVFAYSTKDTFLQDFLVIWKHEGLPPKFLKYVEMTPAYLHWSYTIKLYRCIDIVTTLAYMLMKWITFLHSLHLIKNAFWPCEKTLIRCKICCTNIKTWNFPIQNQFSMRSIFVVKYLLIPTYKLNLNPWI